MKSRLIFFVLVSLIAASSLFAAGNDTPLVKTKSTKQGWLGVSIQDVTPRLAREKELKVKEGAFVNEVVEESPADSAGVKTGDVIVEFAGKKIELADDLTKEVQATKPGTKVSVTVNRNGEKKTLTAYIGKNKTRMPLALAAPRTARIIMNRMGKIEGMELMELNKQLGEYFEAPNGRGVLVKEVEKESNAEKAGIKAGDVITKIGDETIRRFDDVHEALEDADEGDKVSVEILRKGKKNTVTLEISERNFGNMWYWDGDNANKNFEFRIHPQLEKMQRELDIRMKELPRIQKDLERGRFRECSIVL
jgi:serine protease Do